MYRLFFIALIAIASMSASIAFSPSAHAQPTRISGKFGVKELYPKTLKRYKRGKAKMARLKRAFQSAKRTGDTRRMDSIRKSYKKTSASVKRALRKLKAVRGVTTVVVWGDAGNKMGRSKIASFLRKTRKWQGRTVHFYARDGKLKVGGGAPRVYDDRKNRRKKPRSTRSTRRSGRTPSTLSPGFIPVTRTPYGGGTANPGPGSGLFGLGY